MDPKQGTKIQTLHNMARQVSVLIKIIKLPQWRDPVPFLRSRGHLACPLASWVARTPAPATPGLVGTRELHSPQSCEGPECPPAPARRCLRGGVTIAGGGEALRASGLCRLSARIPAPQARVPTAPERGPKNLPERGGPAVGGLAWSKDPACTGPHARGPH